MQRLVTLIIVVLDIWAVVDVVKSGKSGGAKALWIILIVVLPIIGLLAWFFAGREKAAPA